METASARPPRRSQVARGLAVALGVTVLGLVLLGLGAAVDARPLAIAHLSHRLGRPVHVDGDLAVRPGLQGLTVRFTRLRVDQAAWAGPGPMVAVDRGVVKLPWTALFGDVKLQDVELDGLRLRLRRDAQGRANWSGAAGGGPAPPAPRGAPGGGVPPAGQRVGCGRTRRRFLPGR